MGLFLRQTLIRFGQPGVPGRGYSGLRIGFDVHMCVAGRPGTGKIRVYNLADEAVAALQKSGCVVELLVGYDVPRLIFRGSPVRLGVASEKQGVDRITTIDAQDGGRAYSTARVAVSFTQPTTLAQVFAAVQAQLGLAVGTIRLPSGGEAVSFPHGIVLSGSATDVLDRLARASAADWFVRDGALQFVANDGDTGESAVVFSADAGNLIGSPAPKTDGTVEVRGLLDPSLRPGRPFIVRAAQNSGAYVARDVQFTGDSGWETPFYVVATGRPRRVSG